MYQLMLRLCKVRCHSSGEFAVSFSLATVEIASVDCFEVQMEINGQRQTSQEKQGRIYIIPHSRGRLDAKTATQAPSQLAFEAR